EQRKNGSVKEELREWNVRPRILLIGRTEERECPGGLVRVCGVVGGTAAVAAVAFFEEGGALRELLECGRWLYHLESHRQHCPHEDDHHEDRTALLAQNLDDLLKPGVLRCLAQIVFYVVFQRLELFPDRRRRFHLSLHRHWCHRSPALVLLIHF